MTLSRRHAVWLLIAGLGSSPKRGPRESTEVVRAQVELSVCDLRAAGTGDPVGVSLGGTVTWLDYPGPDLQRRGRYRYDLLLDGVRTLADIRQLAMSKAGSDDLCLSQLLLIINGRPIFSRAFGGGAWLHTTLVTSGAELRANASWERYDFSMAEWVSTTGAVLLRREVLDRVESGVATAIHDAGLSWNDRTTPPIDIARKDDATLRVTAQLTRPVPFWFDEQLVLTFDLSVCQEGQAEVIASGVTLSGGADAHTAAIVRYRLARAQMLVLAGGVCPRVDSGANVVY